MPHQYWDSPSIRRLRPRTQGQLSPLFSHKGGINLAAPRNPPSLRPARRTCEREFGACRETPVGPVSATPIDPPDEGKRMSPGTS
ncbi:MAG: hypothetical protein [Circular genetic element sp.]|nr:MAG: hypothetical protein [Circular genetic element sp.]